MKILVISDHYPSFQQTTKGVFVYKLVQKFVDKGHKVSVIAPQKIWESLSKGNPYGEEKAQVYRPKFISFSAKSSFGFNTYKLTNWAQAAAIRNTVKKHTLEFDLVYGHFLRNAFCAIDALHDYDKPFFVAVGENAGIEMTLNWFGRKRFTNLLHKIACFVAVSDQIKEKLLSKNIPDNKIIVEPNGVDLAVFRKADKMICRKKYSINETLFVLAFIGNFIQGKGPERILKAIDGLANVGVIFVGSGPIKLFGEQVIINRRVPSHEVPELLNCADVFVLPTLHEGSNNSIVEAMACGLPIISSDIPEVRSQCDPSFSILVNPMNIEAIRAAIIKLYKNPELCKKMSQNAILWSKRFDLSKRASTILNFLKTHTTGG